MKVLGIIPCRYGSKRFPGKPLADIGGKSMIQRVFEQASKSFSLHELVIATDDERIFNHAKQFTEKVLITSGEHQNGTERCNEAMAQLKSYWDFVINIQGDEPFLHPAHIDLVVSCLVEGGIDIATLVKKIDRYEDYLNPSIVKVVCGRKGKALYFSRGPIPHISSAEPEQIFTENKFYKHIGIYGYKSDVLKKISRLPSSPLERIEMLEQLRWLENGFIIKTRETILESHAVDVPEDLEKLRQL